ncbi:MAG: hypothetical protein OFPII_00100 [Osedax symbiont Rs1]|nr:MAG: hypothetical protein OFPII_00100 [Osedax symbiont Rs1]
MLLRIISTILLSLSSQWVASATNGEECANCRACKEIKVSGSLGWYPLLMEHKQSGRIEGVAIELMQMIGKELNTPVKFVKYPWKRMFQHLELGTIDIVLGVYKTKKRALIYNYSSAFLVNEARVFTRADKVFEFTHLKDLIGLKGDIPLGGSFGDHFDNFAKKHLQISELKAPSAIIRRLILGRSDFFVSDYHDAIQVINQELIASSEKIVALPLVIARNSVYFAMSKRSSCAALASTIFSTLQRLIDKDTVRIIIERQNSMGLKKSMWSE